VYLYPTENGVTPEVGETTTIFYGAQLEPSPYATSYIPTTSVPVTRTADAHSWTMSEEFKNLMGNVADSPFTMVCEWTPKFDYTGHSGDIIEVNTNTVSLFRHVSNGFLESDDGPGLSGVRPNYTANTTYLFALRVMEKEVQV